MRTRGGTASENTNGKNRKLKKSPTSKLRIRRNKYSQEFKAKNKERLEKWKVSTVVLCYNHLKM